MFSKEERNRGNGSRFFGPFNSFRERRIKPAGRHHLCDCHHLCNHHHYTAVTFNLIDLTFLKEEGKGTNGSLFLHTLQLLSKTLNQTSYNLQKNMRKREKNHKNSIADDFLGHPCSRFIYFDPNRLRWFLQTSEFWFNQNWNKKRDLFGPWIEIII